MICLMSYVLYMKCNMLYVIHMNHTTMFVQSCLSVLQGACWIAYTGNDAEDACGRSPAGAPGVIAVGAVDSQIRRWYTSNW